MMQRRTVLSSLLLVSLLSAFAFSSAIAQNSVTVASQASQRCVTGTVDVSVDLDQAASGLEIVLDYSGDATVNSVTFDAGLANLAGIRGVDMSVPGKLRIWALDDSGGSDCLAAGSHVIAQIEYTTDDVCSGSLDFTGGDWSCENGVSASSQIADCNQNPALIAATVNAGSISINNSAPSITCPDDYTMHWGAVEVVSASATDPDEANGCESLTFSLSPGAPDWASIAQNGNITLSPDGGDVCETDIVVYITDACDAVDSCTFTVCVQNDPPVITCPDDPDPILWGEMVCAQATTVDPDNGPVSPSYSIVSFNGPGAPTVDASGNVCWQTEEDPAYIGTFEVCVAVTDGANVCDPCSPANADTCCFSFTVLPTLRVVVEKVHNVIQGGPVDVDLYFEDCDVYENYPIAGFDLLIDYDPSALLITGASEGGFFTGNTWEYFTYRFGPNGNCGSGCPAGKFRIVGLAETNNGAAHPTGYTNVSAGSNVLATLHFNVTNDRNLECQFAPVKWCWYDCGDNAFSSVSGDTLFISRYVYEYAGDENCGFGDGGAGSIAQESSFPTLLGANSDCDVSGGPDKPEPIRGIDFRNGGVDIVCADSIDARGDINLNGVSNEIADAVVFTNYFVEGLGAFNINVEGQIAATEVNADGIPLTVADLVYLIRVIVGDALPFPKLVHNNTAHIIQQGTVVSTESELGAALFTYSGNALNSVKLLAEGMEVKSGIVDGNTHVLVYSLEGATISAGEIVSVDAELLSVEAASVTGEMLSLEQSVLPTEFAVYQNYPNPFNPKTNIPVALPYAAPVKVSIFNVAGQLVDVIEQEGSAGVLNIEWDARVSSGVYFYKVEVANLVVTKKMVLLK